MARFIIKGGKKISGTFEPSGNKNAVLPMLAACLLTGEKITLHNVPVIQDVVTMLEIIEALGVNIEQNGNTVTLRAATLRKKRLKRELCSQVRSSILFAGPLVARQGQAVIYPPGGDVIGQRRLDSHFIGLRALGIEISGGDHFAFRGSKLRGAKILLDEASVTATENIIMAAVLAEGVTTLFNAACEPHVQDLCRLLNKMGARITGVGTNFITIEGVEALHGAEHQVNLDHIEIGSFLAAAAVTGGELIINDVETDYIAPLFRPFGTLGMDLRFGKFKDAAGSGLRSQGLCFGGVGPEAHALPITLDSDEGRATPSLARRLHSLKLYPRPKMKVRPDYGLAIPKIEDGPWPSFPSDLMSIAIVVGTQTTGTVLFFEKMFESRMYFVDRLIDMGARIVPCDPHRVVVIGPARLHAIPMSSPDIRAGMAMLIAALCARGTSVIHNAQVIDRGYERIEERLRALGAEIVREK